MPLLADNISRLIMSNFPTSNLKHEKRQTGCFHLLGIVIFPTELWLCFCLHTHANLHVLKHKCKLQIHTWSSPRHSCGSHRDEGRHTTRWSCLTQLTHTLRLVRWLFDRKKNVQTKLLLNYYCKKYAHCRGCFSFFQGGEPVLHAGGPCRSLPVEGTHRTYAATSLPPLTLNFKGLQQLFSPRNPSAAPSSGLLGDGVI